MTRAFAVTLLAFALPAVAQPAQNKPLNLPQNQPRILLGVDAQSPATFDKVKAIGANTLIRFDPGPQKNITLEAWMNEARRKELFYIVQGTVFFSDKHPKPNLTDSQLIAIAQDDEPDLNRWHNGQDNPLRVAEGRFKGWTKPEILAELYADWKKRAPKIPVIVNFAGQHVSNAWYVDGAGHKPYIDATDWVSFDWYVRNNNADRYLINFVGWTMDKLTKWSENKPQFAYIECSDQVLDGDAKGGIGRGPTPAETTTQIWHALAHGAKGVWLFPQRIRGGFDYWAITPENETAIKDTFALIKKHDLLLAEGTRVLKEEFPANPTHNDPAKKWPTWEEVTWTSKDGKQTLTVKIDLTGEKAPEISGVPAPASPLQRAGRAASPATDTPTPKTKEPGARPRVPGSTVFD